MESKKKFTITIAVLAIALLISIATMIIVIVSAYQNASSAVNVKYTAEEVYVELSAKAIIGATTTTFVSNGQTSIELSPTNTTGELSQPNSANQSIDLNKTDDTVVFEYLFKNKTDSIDVKIDLTSIPAIKENLNVSYVYSDTQITNVAGLEGDTTYTAQLLPAYTGETTTKYIYIIAQIDNLLYNSSLEGNFQWALSKPAESEVKVFNLNIGTTNYVERGGSNLSSWYPTSTTYTYRSLSSTINPDDISLFPARFDYAFMGWATTEGATTALTSSTTTTTLYPVYKAGNVTATSSGWYVTGLTNNSDTQAIIPDVYSELGDDFKVTGIGPSAFANTNITSVHFGRYINGVACGAGAFSGCSKLTSVVFSDRVTGLDDSVFKNCTSLVSVTLSRNMTYIHYNTFENCTSLNNIIIPDGVTEIKTSAFEGCSALTSIHIPGSVAKIEAYAFADCTSLSSATFDTTSWVFYPVTGDDLDLNLTSDSAQNAECLTSTYTSGSWNKK